MTPFPPCTYNSNSPTGTGKTFLGVFLAQVILSSTSENILCVCYTNHALDSFLEDMLEKGVTDMVRIGGGSKSPKLERYQLRNREAYRFNQVQNRQYARLMSALEDSEERIRGREHSLNCSSNKKKLLEWLEDEDPEASMELRLPEHIQRHGNTVVGKKVRAYIVHTAGLMLYREQWKLSCECDVRRNNDWRG